MTNVQEAAQPKISTKKTAAISLTGITKTFGKATVVNNINLNVEKGSFIGLLGPNGAGKTTTISIVSGLIAADAGRCEVAGFDVAREAGRVKKVLGVVPQDLAVYPELSARQNLQFFGAMYGLRGTELSNRVEDALTRVGLGDRAKKPAVGKFSGGQKRRLNIAAALLHRPEILILDEPTVGVDPQSRNHIFDTLRELNREGMTIVYVTHYMEEVEALCSEVAIIDHGTVIERGTLADILQQHGTSVVRLVLTPLEAEAARSLLERHPEVTWRSTENEALEISAKHLQDAIAVLTEILTLVAPNPEACEILPPSLETVFIALTGNRLRDE